METCNDKKYYITIGRQFCAGGLELAEKLSRRLNIPMYDKELLTEVSKQSGLCREILEKADEKRGSMFSGGLFGIDMCSLMSGYYGNISVIDKNSIFQVQCDTICSIADRGPAIFVGRCADYVLRERKSCLSVFITSDDEHRILRYRERMKCGDEVSDAKIMDILEDTDRKRSSYYDGLTFKEWGDSSSYDLCLDTSRFGIDGCIDLIFKALEILK